MPDYWGEYFDADAHVQESEQTWSHLDPAFADRRPVIVTLKDGAVPIRGQLNAIWLVEGKAIPNPVGPGQSIVGPNTSRFAESKPYKVGSQQLTDVAQRLKEMDAMGIREQVMFPSLLAFSVGVQLTDDALFEAALFRSYNSFIAKACGQVPDRLKWAGIIPLRAVAEGVKEVERVKKLGAVAVVIFGTVGEMMLYAAEFDPFWRACAEADLPVCIHLSRSFTPTAKMVDFQYAGAILASQLTIPMGFFSIVGGGVMDRHPTLRFVFLEAGCQWIPFMVDQMAHYQKAYTHNGYPFDHRLPERDILDYVNSGRLYVTAEAEDKLLPYVAEMIGEEQFLFSSDMPHGEGRDNAALEVLARNDISDSFKRKILIENGPRFYGFAPAAAAAGRAAAKA